MIVGSTRAARKAAAAALIAVSGVLQGLPGAGAEDIFRKRRDHMVREVITDMAATAGETGRAVLWEEHAPFDAIMVTAAAPRIPPPLVRQLKPGGTLVVPVGPPFLTQFLTVVKEAPDGTVSTRQVLPVAFVPLTGGGKRSP